MLPEEEIFYLENHRKIFLAAKKLFERGSPIDLVTLYNLLQSHRQGDVLAVVIANINQAYVSSVNLDSYISIVRERFMQRAIMDLASDISLVGNIDTEHMRPMLNKYSNVIDKIYTLGGASLKSMEEITNESTENILKGANIIRTHLPYMDKFASGYTRGELIALGGRPGHGKTTLMIANVKATIENGHSVVVLNREMTNIEFIKKLMVLESPTLTYDMFRQESISDVIAKQINEAKDIIINKYKKLIIFDNIMTLDDGIGELLRIKPDIFFDDYIQLIEVSGLKVRGGDSYRRFEIERIMRSYKRLCKQHNMVGFLISQLSRDIEKRLDPIPTMGDYAEGSTIEQLAEACLFIVYPYAFDPQNTSQFQAEIIAKKVRYGKIGTYEVGYNGNKCSFYQDPATAYQISHPKEK
jgi:replicative DNA helicase